MLMLRQPVEPARARTRPTVVCVDEDLALLAELSRSLECEWFNLILTSDPPEAVEIVRSGRASLVLARHPMRDPGVAGFRDAIRQAAPQVACVMITERPDADLVRERAGGLIQGLIVKPWSDRELLALVLRLLDLPIVVPLGRAS